MTLSSLRVCVRAAHGKLPTLDGYSLSGGRSDWYVRFGNQSCAVVDDTEAPTWDSCCGTFAAGTDMTFELIDYDYLNDDDTCCATSVQLLPPIHRIDNLTLALTPGEQRFLDLTVEGSSQPPPPPPPSTVGREATCTLQTSASSWTGGSSLDLLLGALALDLPGELGAAALDGGVALAVRDLHCDSMRLSGVSLRGWVTPDGRSLALAATLGAGAHCQATLAFSEPFWAAGLSPRVSLRVESASAQVEAAAELGPGGGALNLSTPHSPLFDLGAVDLGVHFDEWYVSDTAVSALVSEAWDLFRTAALQAAADAMDQLLSTSVALPTPRPALWWLSVARWREPWDTWAVRGLLGWALRPRSPVSLRWLLARLSDDDGTVTLPVPPQPPIPIGSLLGVEAPPINGSGSGGAIAWQLASARLRVPTGTLEDGGDGAGGETLAGGTLAVPALALIVSLRVGWWPATPLSVEGGVGLEELVVKPVTVELSLSEARLKAATVLRLAEEGDGYELLLSSLRLELESVVLSACSGGCDGGGGGSGEDDGGCSAGGGGSSLEFGALRGAEAERLGGLVRDIYNDAPLQVPFVWLRALALVVAATTVLVVAIAVGCCRCAVWWVRWRRTASATQAMRARALLPRKVVMV